MLSENEIIEGCARHDRRAQQMLYDRYSRLLFGVCMRYASEKAEAEDILQESFLKIYFSIREYSGTGSFTGWMRKIVVNTAITHYHRNLKHKHYVEIEEYVSIETGVSSFEEDFFTSDELFKVLNELPPGYRMVFNLYAIEGYKHKEIAEMLGIDINTSKSQYSRAKAALRDKLEGLRKLKEKYNAEDNITDIQK
ncbi:MAG: RNA polymerase sigma factor [Bacteroidales bacterium]